VRSALVNAAPDAPAARLQCHPFAHNRYLFMHNGVIAGFAKIKRKLLSHLSDAAYDAVQSFHSDSAVSFALFLSFLPSMTEALPADALMRALQHVFELVMRTQKEAGVDAECSLLNYVVTDGGTLIATRYVTPDSAGPASLYYAEGTTFRCATPPQPSDSETHRVRVIFSNFFVIIAACTYRLHC
jgi:glutamine amidotransferase